jgi:hypothetical protein
LFGPYFIKVYGSRRLCFTVFFVNLGPNFSLLFCYFLVFFCALFLEEFLPLFGYFLALFGFIRALYFTTFMTFLALFGFIRALYFTTFMTFFWLLFCRLFSLLFGAFFSHFWVLLSTALVGPFVLGDFWTFVGALWIFGGLYSGHL